MSQTAPSGIQIARTAKTCAATGRPFEPDEPIVACLVEPAEPTAETSGETTMVRIDTAQAAWSTGNRVLPEGAVVAVWKTRARDTLPSDAPEQMTEVELADFFESLEPSDEPRRAGFRYLLCLYLIRRRVLVPEPTEEGSRGTIHVRRKPTARHRAPEPGAPIIETPDPGLDEAALTEAATDLARAIGIDAIGGTPGVEAASGVSGTADAGSNNAGKEAG